jgi:hypothetical protein
MPLFSTGSQRGIAPDGPRVGLRTLASAVSWLASGLALATACAQQVHAADSPADAGAIRAAAATYRDALAKGDAAAIRAAWTTDGDIVDGWGNRLLALDMATAGPATADGPRPEFHFGETKIRFLTSDVALEDGTVDVVLPGMQTPVQGWFSAVWVRQGNAWKLAGLRESERPVVAGPDMVADLDWMVGDWMLEVEGKTTAMEMTVRWDAARSFLIREARVPVVDATDADATVIEVRQQVGWDPLVRRIRSWSFSSDGSRAEATWFRDGDSWIAEQTAVLPSGRQETTINIYSYDGRDRCVWRMLPEGLESDEGRPTRATWIRKPKGVER